MTRKNWISVLLSSLLILPVAVGLAAPRLSMQAQPTWKRFRDAVERNDLKALAAMTQFPLQTRGPNDGDSIVMKTVEEFPTIIDHALSVDSGMTETSLPVRDYIQQVPQLKPSHFSSPDQFRVANLVFRRRNGSWRLTQVFLDQ
jgi:hypothetical protein